jgi:hypothetical protein
MYPAPKKTGTQPNLEHHTVFAPGTTQMFPVSECAYAAISES